ncbi:MAG: hypothetical protein WBF90_10350 [Rivularia sp. (in: cyanobacteria)]
MNVNNIALADTFEEREEDIEKLREQKERIDELNQKIKELELQQKIINEKKAAAELREAAADAEKAAVNAEKAAAGAYFPNIDSSKFNLREGTIEPTGLTFESEVLAVRAMDSVGEKIQAEIVNKLGSRVSLIVSDKKELLSAIFGQFKYRAFKDKVDFFKRKYGELNVVIPSKLPAGTRGGNPVINPATAATASFLFELLPFFRVNSEIKETLVTVTTRDFIAQLGGKFQESGNSQVSIYYPAEYPLINKDAVNDVLKEISTIKQLQNLASKNILSSPNSNQLQELNDSVDIFIKDLHPSTDKIKSAANGISQKSPLQQIISSRALELITDSSNKTYFLSVDVFAKGSQRKTKTFLNSRLRHSGGVIVKYIIYDQNASIVLSNVHHSYTGFRKVRTSK